MTTGSMRTLLPEVFYRNPMPSAVNEFSAEACYLEVNDAWLAFFGFARDQVLGKALREVETWASDEERHRLGKLLHLHSRIHECEGLARRADGGTADILFSWEPFEHAGRDCMLWVFTDITARKAAERRLQQSETRFEKLVESSPQPMSISRLADGVYLGVNRAMEAMLGYPRVEMIGKSSLELGVWVDPAVRDELRRQFAAGQEVATVETQVRANSGQVIDIQFSSTVIELEGVPVLHGTAVNLTLIKLAVLRQNASEERAAQLFRASPNPIVITRLADGVYVEMNHAWQDQFGYLRAETLGKSSRELGVWVEYAEREHFAGQLQREGTVRDFETRLRHRSGKEADVLLSAEVINVSGEQCAIIGTVDISERKRAERLRAASEVRFAKVFQASPNPIVFSRVPDGHDIQVNGAWHKLFGYTVEDIRGQTSTSLDLWVDAGFRDRRETLLADGGEAGDLETQMRAKSGAIIDVLISSEHFAFDNERYIVAVITDISARKSADRQIEYLATRDHLTGLPNRVLFSDRLQQSLVKAARDHTHTALLFVDLDHFKNINDTLGHHAGDHVLTEVAARLTSAVRGADTVGRQGGDEFLLLLEGLATALDAGPVAEKLISGLSEPVLYQGQALRVSCSIGVSVYPDDAATEADLMRNADLAMYAAKAAGRNAFHFYTPGMNLRLVERMSLEADLRDAVERGEFILHYQPKVNFDSGLVTGCEALLRWRRGGGAPLQPDRFIGVAEDSGLIAPIGTWVLREACRSLRRWIDADLEVVPVACNVSVHQFTPALPRLIADILLETGVPPYLLQLEITETVMMQNAAAHLETMRQLKEIGLNIALDDFGTGYSSLSYLRHMDLDVLKIDRSFVRDVASNADTQTIVSAIIAMAGQFGMQTVAEGVETVEQAQALRRMHCNEYQGYLFCPPLPRDQFESGYLHSA